MFGSQGVLCNFGWWWIFPLIMIVFCFFMMKGRMGSMMCRPGSRSGDSHGNSTESALDVLDKRYAQGEINKSEYEEKKRVITKHE